MKLKDFIAKLNQYDLEKDIIFSDGENYPYSFSTIDIGKLGIVDDSYVIDEMMFEDEEVEFDKDHPVKDVVVIKIDYGVF